MDISRLLAIYPSKRVTISGVFILVLCGLILSGCGEQNDQGNIVKPREELLTASEVGSGVTELKSLPQSPNATVCGPESGAINNIFDTKKPEDIKQFKDKNRTVTVGTIQTPLPNYLLRGDLDYIARQKFQGEGCKLLSSGDDTGFYSEGAPNVEIAWLVTLNQIQGISHEGIGFISQIWSASTKHGLPSSIEERKRDEKVKGKSFGRAYAIINGYLVFVWIDSDDKTAPDPQEVKTLWDKQVEKFLKYHP